MTRDARDKFTKEGEQNVSRSEETQGQQEVFEAEVSGYRKFGKFLIHAVGVGCEFGDLTSLMDYDCSEVKKVFFCTSPWPAPHVRYDFATPAEHARFEKAQKDMRLAKESLVEWYARARGESTDNWVCPFRKEYGRFGLGECHIQCPMQDDSLYPCCKEYAVWFKSKTPANAIPVVRKLEKIAGIELKESPCEPEKSHIIKLHGEDVRNDGIYKVEVEFNKNTGVITITGESFEPNAPEEKPEQKFKVGDYVVEQVIGLCKIVSIDGDVIIISFLGGKGQGTVNTNALRQACLSDFEVDKNGVKGLMQYDKAGDIKLKINGECIAWFIGEWTTKAKHLARFMGMQIAPANIKEE